MKTRLYLFSVLLMLLLGLTACGGQELPAQQLSIQGLDIKFDVTMLQVQAGQPIELTYKNSGSIDHAFKIEGLVDEVKIRPGQSHVFKFTVDQPGEYPFVCAMPGHEMAGMVGRLMVQ